MRVSILTDHDIRRIHDASLSILERFGVHVPHDSVLSLFQDAGALVDPATSTVRIPEPLIERCLNASGKSFTLYGRDRSIRAEFGVGKRNYNTIFGEAHWLDDEGHRRFSSLEDVGTAARLADALPWLNVVGAMSDPHEIPVECRCVLVAAELLRNTTKPIGLWFHDRDSAKFLLQLLCAVAGGEDQLRQYPFCYPFLEPISPLRFPFRGLDLLFETSHFDLPVPVGPMAQTGATAPGTLAGTLAQENAEILAGICIVQLIKPGIPICYGGIPHAFDMRTTQMIFSGPEQALMAVAMTEMGKFYGLPVYINVGLTDSKIPDAQAGLEVGITLACGAMAGADIFGHLGISGVDQASSLDMLLMQHEAIGYVERMMRGIEISDEKIGLDAIERGLSDGSYLADEHTVRHFREELWFPDLLDRQYFDAWVQEGRKSMKERCLERRREILAKHVPQPLDDDTERVVADILASAKKHLSG